MLRCTIASLIPLMMSGKYSKYTDDFFVKYFNLFNDIIRHGSYYILTDLPQSISEKLFLPAISGVINKQRNTGLWKVKDSEKYSYEILSVFKHLKIFDLYIKENKFKYDIKDKIREKTDFYSILTKLQIFENIDVKDKTFISKYIKEIKEKQNENGSWYDTVIGTTVNIENLLLLKVDKDDPSIKKGIEFLFNNFKSRIQGDHAGRPYDLVANNMFSTENTNMEFEIADKLNIEWISKNVCFRHLPVIQNAVCLKLLLKLDFENDGRLESALDNLFFLHSQYNGFCQSNIYKSFIEK